MMFDPFGDFDANGYLQNKAWMAWIKKISPTAAWTILKYRKFT
ncbi:hypothetical protein [Serratia marcescens]|jgi:hypothetical protein|nr:hypothetical protein [Serratia marcescens]